MSEIALVYILYGDGAAAQAAALEMVERKLAACANVLAPGVSIYPWDGKIEQSRETAVMFKTGPACVDALMAALAQGHAYDLPAILSWPVTTTAQYAAWVGAQTGANPPS